MASCEKIQATATSGFIYMDKPKPLFTQNRMNRTPNTGRRLDPSPPRSISDMVKPSGIESRLKFITGMTARLAPEWKNIYR